MAGNNEAKIKFSAETKEFDSAIKNAKNEIKDASQEIRLAAAEFKNTGDAAEYYEKKHEALEKKLEATKDQQEALTGKIEVAAAIYGEGSDEVQKLESQLVNCQIAEQNIISQITACNDAMQQQAAESEAAGSAMGQLQNAIEQQTGELAELKDAYANAYVEYGPMSDECQALAGQIEELSGNLNDNMIALEDAKTAADQFVQPLDDLRGGADEAGSALDQLKGTIEDQTTELDQLKEAYQNAYLEYGPMSDECQALAGQIEELSGQLSENQQRLEEAAGAADALDGSFSGAESSVGTLGDKFGETGDKAGDMSDAFDDSLKAMVNATGIGAVIDIIGQVIGAIGGVADAVDGMRQDWENACDVMANSTGDVGAELDSLQSSMQGAYKDSRNLEMSQEDMAAICGQIRTLFGSEGEELENLGVRMSEFSYVTGADGVEATTKLYQIMQKWGDQAGTNEQVIDKLTHAAQTSGDSISTIMKIMSDCHGAMDALGMSFDEGVGFIEAYCQAGGNASDVSRILTTAQKNLSESGMDAGEAWDLATRAMSDSKNSMEGLNATIGDTDLKISDVFGSGKAGQAIVDVFANGKVATDEYTEAVKNSGGQLERTMMSNTSVVDKYKNVWKGLKSDIGSALQDAAEYTGSYEQQIASLGDAFRNTTTAATEMALSSSACSDDMGAAFERVADISNTSVEGIMYALSSGQISVEQFAEAAQVSADDVVNVLDVYVASVETVGHNTIDAAGLAGQGFVELQTTAGESITHVDESLSDMIYNVLNTMQQTGTASTEMQNAFVQLSYQTGESVSDIIANMLNGSLTVEDFAKRTGVSTTEVQKFTQQFSDAFNTAAGAIDGATSKASGSVGNFSQSVYDAMVKNGTCTSEMQAAFNSLSSGTGKSVSEIITSLLSGGTSVQEFASQTGVSAGEIEKFTSNYKKAYETANKGVEGANKSAGDSTKDMEKTGSAAVTGLKETTVKATGGAEAATKQFAQQGANNVGIFANGTKSEMQGVANATQNAMNQMAASTNVTLPHPYLPMPHINISGTWNSDPPSAPEYSVSWYKTGGLIMNTAQIFGVNAATGQFLGGGEAGPEAILPIDLLKDYISDVIGGYAVPLDYDLLADKIAGACSRIKLTTVFKDREVGRMVRSVM